MKEEKGRKGTPTREHISLYTECQKKILPAPNSIIIIRLNDREKAIKRVQHKYTSSIYCHPSRPAFIPFSVIYYTYSSSWDYFWNIQKELFYKTPGTCIEKLSFRAFDSLPQRGSWMNGWVAYMPQNLKEEKWFKEVLSLFLSCGLKWEALSFFSEIWLGYCLWVTCHSFDFFVFTRSVDTELAS